MVGMDCCKVLVVGFSLVTWPLTTSAIGQPPISATGVWLLPQ